MKLKFYLRGLGLGLIVAALVLGVHHARFAGASGTMTDDEIKARAAQLGMIDGSSRLTDDELSTEEMLAELQDNDVTNVTNETADMSAGQDAASAADQDVDSGSAEETASDVIADAAALIEDTTAEITTDAPDDPGLDYPTEDDSFTMLEPETITSEPISDTDSETDHEFTPAQDTAESVSASGGSSGGGAGTITISSGDSSDRVARKLADAGIVASAADYDKFLCTHGYDRILRTGTYSFSDGMSDDEIARVITGR
ncbi:MAG: hypothetical protein J5509_01765 [Lachnospiraceae bacterium]|nr:hypothetical protein [Lachnospiraceae bacterium]